VWAPEGHAVVGYYAVAPHLVRRQDVPKKIGRGRLEEIPAFLLARLALVERLQGRGLGTALLADALTRIVHAIDLVGGGVIVVDAIDERAARFYERNGFIPTPADAMRLVIKASDVRASR
jgi:GNAT superfamily N-acetyltransferase